MSRSPLPRGLRARLTATYTLAAALLIVAGAAVFLFVLTAGLRANLDGDLASRADTVAAVLAAMLLLFFVITLLSERQQAHAQAS